MRKSISIIYFYLHKKCQKRKWVFYFYLHQKCQKHKWVLLHIFKLYSLAIDKRHITIKRYSRSPFWKINASSSISISYFLFKLRQRLFDRTFIVSEISDWGRHAGPQCTWGTLHVGKGLCKDGSIAGRGYFFFFFLLLPWKVGPKIRFSAFFLELSREEGIKKKRKEVRPLVIGWVLCTKSAFWHGILFRY